MEVAWSFSRALAENLVGRTTANAKEALAGSLHDHPFSVAAFTAAIEMLEGHSILSLAEEIRVPLLGAVNATDHDAIPGEVERLLAEGYGTLKVKVGFDVDDDLERLQVIQEAVAGRRCASTAIRGTPQGTGAVSPPRRIRRGSSFSNSPAPPTTGRPPRPWPRSCGCQ